MLTTRIPFISLVILSKCHSTYNLLPEYSPISSSSHTLNSTVNKVVDSLYYLIVVSRCYLFSVETHFFPMNLCWLSGPAIRPRWIILVEFQLFAFRFYNVVWGILYHFISAPSWISIGDVDTSTRIFLMLD